MASVTLKVSTPRPIQTPFLYASIIYPVIIIHAGVMAESAVKLAE